MVQLMVLIVKLLLAPFPLVYSACWAIFGVDIISPIDTSTLHGEMSRLSKLVRTDKEIQKHITEVTLTVTVTVIVIQRVLQQIVRL